MLPEARTTRILWILAGLGALTLLSAALYLTLGSRGNWAFAIKLRAGRLAGLALVAVAIALATVAFQTLTRNRILTPSIMGFDALFVLIQTVLVFVIGAAAASSINPQLMFVVEVVVLTCFAGLLFGWLFGGSSRSLHLLLLVGIVFGTAFRAVASLLQRLISPDDFIVLQDRMFASFTSVDQGLLLIAAACVLVCAGALWRLAPALDVLALGRDAAIGLGLNHDRLVLAVLAIVTVLVAVSTALVGPVGFFGLLVANLALMILPTARHRVVMPVAALIALVALIGGQTLLERGLGYDGALSVIIEFLGGLVFLALVIRGGGK